MIVRKKELAELLTRLVGEAKNQDELGGCIWCGCNGKSGAYGYCDETYDCHKADCPWMAAHKLLTSIQ